MGRRGAACGALGGQGKPGQGKPGQGKPGQGKPGQGKPCPYATTMPNHRRALLALSFTLPVTPVDTGAPDNQNAPIGGRRGKVEQDEAASADERPALDGAGDQLEERVSTVAQERLRAALTRLAALDVGDVEPVPVVRLDRR